MSRSTEGTMFVPAHAFSVAKNLHKLLSSFHITFVCGSVGSTTGSQFVLLVA